MGLEALGPVRDPGASQRDLGPCQWGQRSQSLLEGFDDKLRASDGSENHLGGSEDQSKVYESQQAGSGGWPEGSESRLMTNRIKRIDSPFVRLMLTRLKNLANKSVILEGKVCCYSHTSLVMISSVRALAYSKKEEGEEGEEEVG